MTWSRGARTALLLFGIGAGVVAGHLFYGERLAPGGAFLLMAGVSFWAATRARDDEDEPRERASIVDDAALVEMALFISEVAVSGLRGVGRTMPPSTKEIDQLEGRMDVLLDKIGAPSSRRAQLREELDRLRGRARRNEGGLALARSARL